VSVQVQGSIEQRRHLIDEPTRVGAARRDAQQLAREQGLNDTLVGRVGIIATELANNLLQHGGGGELLLQPIVTADSRAIEVLAIDRGPGMGNVDSCLRDGFSTAGTSGTGLGAVRRLAVEFDLHSVVGEGTVVMARIGSLCSQRFGAVSISMPGELICGDRWQLAADGEQMAAIVIDGLGHGPLAAEAAICSAKAFLQAPFDPPHSVIERAHRSMVGTRGAAAACMRTDRQGRVCYAGVGNIAGSMISAEKSQGLASHNGTLGVRLPRMRQFEYQRPSNSIFVMHSDGLSGRWDLARKDGLLHRHPAVIAAVLYRDHRRERDDATVLVFG
jgi:anti-sigma regulatory factor (Ser/Thr protein kinase)